MDESYSSGSATGDESSIRSGASAPCWNGSPDRRRVKKASTNHSTKRPHPSVTKKCLSKDVAQYARMDPCANNAAPNNARAAIPSSSGKEEARTAPVIRGSPVLTPLSARSPPSLALTYSVFDEDSRDTNSDFEFDEPDPTNLACRSSKKRDSSLVQTTKSQPDERARTNQQPTKKRPLSTSSCDTGCRACSTDQPDNTMARDAAKALLGSIFGKLQKPRAVSQTTDESDNGVDDMPEHITSDQQTVTTPSTRNIPRPTIGAAEIKALDVVDAGHKETPPPLPAVSNETSGLQDAASAELKKISRRETLKSFARQEKITYGQACLIYAADPSLVED